jgi:CheY-like chemotaxis protein
MPVARKTVLIVEDDVHLRRQLSLSLRLVGFQTLEARGALEAIGLFERNHVDALVLDLTLPGLDGLTVKEEIAAHPRTRELPIVILTESQEPPQDVRPAYVLKKPVTPWVIVATLVRCLRECRRDTT